jgi:hypothetical protein
VRINEVGVAYDLIIGYFDKYRAKEHDHDMRQLVYIVNRVPRKQGGIDKQLAEGETYGPH